MIKCTKGNVKLKGYLCELVGDVLSTVDYLYGETAKKVGTTEANRTLDTIIECLNGMRDLSCFNDAKEEE
jgi:hypothetical protein